MVILQFPMLVYQRVIMRFPYKYPIYIYICICIRICIHIHTHTYIHAYIHTCITLHCIALHCIALHCIALHCIALHCIALHCIALHCIALHCIALHCIALHCITLHYITYIHEYNIYIIYIYIWYSHMNSHINSQVMFHQNSHAIASPIASGSGFGSRSSPGGWGQMATPLVGEGKGPIQMDDSGILRGSSIEGYWGVAHFLDLDMDFKLILDHRKRYRIVDHQDDWGVNPFEDISILSWGKSCKIERWIVEWNCGWRTYCNKNFRGWVAGFNPLSANWNKNPRVS